MTSDENSGFYRAGISRNTSSSSSSSSLEDRECRTGRRRNGGRAEGKRAGWRKREEAGKHSAACKFDLVELSVAYIVSCEVTVAWLSAGYNEFGIDERGTTAREWATRPKRREGDSEGERGNEGTAARGGWNDAGVAEPQRCVAGIIRLGGLENMLACVRANEHAIVRKSKRGGRKIERERESVCM